MKPRRPRVETVEIPARCFEVALKRCAPLIEDWALRTANGEAVTLRELAVSCYSAGLADGDTLARKALPPHEEEP